MITPIEIDVLHKNTSKVVFSVCTLVSDHKEYRIMLDSYEKAGFNETNSEFLFIDNSIHNKYDAFSGLNKFIEKALGTYIIFSHQDVEVKFDDMHILTKRLHELNDITPDWAVLSNAGGSDIKRLYKRISHTDHELNQGPFPARVRSIDENFIVLKKASGLRFSQSLKGFHLYGTDICLQAELRGYTCWVIDFHLLHKSTGNLNESFYRAKKEFINYYAGKASPGYIRTPCTIMFISSNPYLRGLMNSSPMITVSKFVKKIQLLFIK